MRSTPTLTLALASTAALLVAGCSKSADRSDEPGSEAAAAASDAAADAVAAPAAGSSARDSVPDIGGVAAPGVAFTFSYAFTLPAGPSAASSKTMPTCASGSAPRAAASPA